MEMNEALMNEASESEKKETVWNMFYAGCGHSCLLFFSRSGLRRGGASAEASKLGKLAAAAADGDDPFSSGWTLTVKP